MSSSDVLPSEAQQLILHRSNAHVPIPLFDSAKYDACGHIMRLDWSNDAPQEIVDVGLEAQLAMARKIHCVGWAGSQRRRMTMSTLIAILIAPATNAATERPIATPNPVLTWWSTTASAPFTNSKGYACQHQHRRFKRRRHRQTVRSPRGGGGRTPLFGRNPKPPKHSVLASYTKKRMALGGLGNFPRERHPLIIITKQRFCWSLGQGRPTCGQVPHRRLPSWEGGEEPKSSPSTRHRSSSKRQNPSPLGENGRGLPSQAVPFA